MSNYVTETLFIFAYWFFPVVILTLVIIMTFLPIIVRLLIRLLKKLKNKEPVNLSPKAYYEKRKDKLKMLILGTRKLFRMPLRVVLGVLYLIVGFILTTQYVNEYYRSKPNVVYTNTVNDQLYIDEKQPILVFFDKPINKDTIVVNTAPTEFGSNIALYSPYTKFLTYINSLVGTTFKPTVYTGLSITPKRSIPYESGVIYYLTGIQSLTGNGGEHEQAINLTTPKFPQVVKANISDQQKDVSITDPITLEFDQPILRSLFYKISLTPETRFSIDKIDNNHLQILFNEPLEQGRTYQLSLDTAIRDVDLSTNDESIDTDVATLFNLTFTTVTPAGIKQITPSGTSINPNTTVQVTFKEPMVASSLEGKISVVPAVPFTLKWVKENEIVELVFAAPLEKAKKYTVTLSKDIQSARGGVLGKDVIHAFETAGVVKVTGHAPASNSRNVSTFTKIQVTFDQPVDKASAQSKVAISPSTSVRYSWKGNTLTITPKNSLKYLTKYIVTIKAGVKSVYGIDSNSPQTYSFTTKSQIVTISVPLYKQGIGTFDCNLVALQMALAAKGISSSVSGMKSYMGYGTPYNESTHTGGNPNADWIDHYGVHWDPVAQYARSRGRSADVKRGWSVSGIAREINNGNPVVIFWYNGLSSQTRYSWHYTYGARPGLHSVVVYGYRGEASNPTGFYIRDPWPSFYQEYYSVGAFLGRWSYFGYSAVVIR